MGHSDLTSAAVSTVSAACLCRGKIVAMNQEKGDQSGRKGLKLRLSGRKRGRQERRDGKVILRRQSLMPAPTDVSTKEDRAVEEGVEMEKQRYSALP